MESQGNGLETVVFMNATQAVQLAKVMANIRSNLKTPHQNQGR